MKAIDSYNDEERIQIYHTYKELMKKLEGTTKADWFVDYKQKTGYAHFTFKGTVSQKLIDLLGRMPTADEIILMVDGYSHFGASCSFNGNNFDGRVNTD